MERVTAAFEYNVRLTVYEGQTGSKYLAFFPVFPPERLIFA